MKEILLVIRKEIEDLRLKGIIRYLIANSSINAQGKSADIDLFLEVSDDANIVNLVESTSIIVFRMTLKYDVLISIYPLKTSLLRSESNQFLRNINQNSLEF